MFRIAILEIRNICPTAFISRTSKKIQTNNEKFGVKMKSTNPGNQCVKCEKCKKIIDKVFGLTPHLNIENPATHELQNFSVVEMADTNKPNEKDINRILTQIFGPSHEEINFVHSKNGDCDRVLQSTFDKHPNEQLEQKFEIIKEPNIFEMEIPLKEGSDLPSKVLGMRESIVNTNSENGIFYTKDDEIAKDCLNIPHNQIDTRLIEKFTKLGVPNSVTNKTLEETKADISNRREGSEKPKQPILGREVDIEVEGIKESNYNDNSGIPDRLVLPFMPSHRIEAHLDGKAYNEPYFNVERLTYHLDQMLSNDCNQCKPTDAAPRFDIEDDIETDLFCERGEPVTENLLKTDLIGYLENNNMENRQELFNTSRIELQDQILPSLENQNPEQDKHKPQDVDKTSKQINTHENNLAYNFVMSNETSIDNFSQSFDNSMTSSDVLSLDTERIPLSEILRRVRLRNRLHYCKSLQLEIKGMLMETPYGKCGKKTPPCPPPTPKCPPPPPCPPPPCPPPPPPCPKPCKPACPPPCPPPPCPKPACPPPCPCPPKDPCAKSESALDINSFLLNIDILSKPKQRLNNLLLISKRNDNTMSTKSTTLINEEIFKRINETSMLFLVKPMQRFIENTSMIIESLAFPSASILARDYEPWVPIPSWPTPKRNEKKQLICPKDGCKQLPPPKLSEPCKSNPCLDLPRK